MSNSIQIEVNGVSADYKESESLPVSLEISTDPFFEVVGTGGIRVDNPAKQLIFPPTLTNQAIFEAIKGELASAAIRINGATIFDGNGQHKLTQRSGERLTGYSMALTGGAKDLFAQLGGKTLRGLDIGTILFNGPNAEATFTGSFDAGDQCVFAPVMYGYTGASDNNMGTDYLRPHVYFASINQAIWELLRIEVVSEFFGTDYFKRFVHLFGVGDQWDVGGTDASELRAAKIFDQNIPVGVTTNVEFPDDTQPPNQDTGGIWGLSSGTCSPGYWTFGGYMDSVQGCTVTFQIDGFFTQTLQAFGTWSVGPILVPATSTFRVVANTFTGATSPGFVGTGAYLTASRSDAPGLGSTISLESCLPGRKITDYLAGISHLFNLGWYYDNIRRKLYVEPRFDYQLDGTWYEGFYTRVSGASPDWSNKVGIGNFSLAPGSKPFNDWLVLNNIPEDSPWYKAAAENGTTEGIQYLGARYDFGGTNKNGQTVPNPYFENLLIADGSIGVGSTTNFGWMASVMPEAEDGATQLPDPTYESGPKYAYYAGEVSGVSWKYNGSTQFTRPELIFKPRPTNPYNVPFSVAFSDYFGNSGTVQYAPGLMRTFYPQWCVMLDRGEVLEGDTWLQFDDIQPSPNLFRLPKLLEINQNRRAFVFLGVEKYQPLKLEASKGTFIELVSVRTEDLANLRSNLQNWYSTFEV